MVLSSNITMDALEKETHIFVKIQTNYGTMKVMLYNETPQHRDNFVRLVKEKFYEGTLFHRVIEGFMIQGGDPISRDSEADSLLGTGGPGYTIPAEIIFPKYYHKRGALAAARTADFINPSRESSGSQFYIVEGRMCTDADLDTLETRLNSDVQQLLFKNIFEEQKSQIEREGLDSVAYNVRVRMAYNKARQLVMETPPFRYTDSQRREYKMFGGAPHLDNQYTVFGELVDGFSVLESIANVETNDQDRPLTDVIIINTKIVKK